MGFLASMFGGGKKQPYIPPVATPAMPTPANTADPSLAGAGDNARQAAIGGLASTVKTSAEGAAAAPVGYKSLLGS